MYVVRKDEAKRDSGRNVATDPKIASHLTYIALCTRSIGVCSETSNCSVVAKQHGKEIVPYKHFCIQALYRCR